MRMRTLVVELNRAGSIWSQIHLPVNLPQVVAADAAIAGGKFRIKFLCTVYSSTSTRAPAGTIRYLKYREVRLYPGVP